MGVPEGERRMRQMADKRLIDANALEQEIINEYFTVNNPSGILSRKGEEIFNSAIDVARCRVRDAETIDAVPVVRCKECIKHGLCSIYRDAKNSDGYCYWGAKMDLEETET